MNPGPASSFVSFISVKLSKISIYSCGIILDFFSLYLFLIVRADGIVGSGVLCLSTLGDGEFILCVTLDVSGVPTLGGAGFIFLLFTLEGAPGLFGGALNRVSSCLSYSNFVSPICTNGVSGF